MQKNDDRASGRGSRRGIAAPRWLPGILALSAVVALGGCGQLVHRSGHRKVQRPPAEAFGFGPRASAGGLFRASVQPAQPIRVGRMDHWRLRIETADGVAVEDAEIVVDGGMPEHGHGLPTRPRVVQHLGQGTYRVEGMKFNMGGWWEVRFRVAAAAGTDSVTFHLDL